MKIIFFILFALIFIPIIIGLRKLTIWIFDKIENVLPSIITFPLIFLALSKIIQFFIVPDIGRDELGWIPSLLMIFFFLSIYALIVLFEKTGDYMIRQQRIWKFFLYIILSLLSLTIVFACQYDLLYTYYNNSFVNVPKGPWWEVTLEFFFYSFGILFTNTISSIECVSIWAKLLASIEVLFSFIVLIFFFSYYKEIGELFHRIEDNKPFNNNVQSIATKGMSRKSKSSRAKRRR